MGVLAASLRRRRRLHGQAVLHESVLTEEGGIQALTETKLRYEGWWGDLRRKKQEPLSPMRTWSARSTERASLGNCMSTPLSV